MPLSFAALIYRRDGVTERALSHGFAVALAGFDVPAPVLTITELRGAPGWSVAFYSSGAKYGPGAAFEELDHACELFEEELPPGIAVRDGARESDAVVYGVTYSDELLLDDAWRFSAGAVTRRFVREGDLGPESGVETPEDSSVEPLDLPEDERMAESVLGPLRGSTLLSRELGIAALPALAGALFEADRRVSIRLFEAGAPAITEATRALCATLGRVEGRGAFPPPLAVAGVAVPAVYEAFIRAYDFDDPADPSDDYRELSLGAIVGTLHFLRAKDLEALDVDPSWRAVAHAQRLCPVAVLRRGALGASGARAGTVAVAADQDTLVLVDAAGRAAEAGPTFAELLHYLALGFRTRDDIEEDLIGALMLRAHLRAGRA